MNRQLTFIAILLSAIFFAPSRVMADECTTQYGGTTTCTSTNITINKQIQNPITGSFVENLGSSDATFSPGQRVVFQLTIKNTGTQAFGTVTVKDVFPNELIYVSGPGSFDPSTNTLTFALYDFKAGENRTTQIIATVDTNKVNKQRSMSCVVNTAEVTGNGKADKDTAQLCIQTNVLGATTLPVAGFEDYALLLPFTLLGLTGIVLLMKRG